MALWQADYQVKPKDKDDFLIQDKIEDVASDILHSTFQLEKSWDSDTIQFGNIDNTCVEITLFDNLVELRCRFDMRSLTKDELKLVVEFVYRINGVFVNQSNMYDAEFDIFARALKSSKAFKFCKDPQTFFEEISSH